MTLESFLTTALAIISLTTLAGMGLMRGTVTGLRESNGDLRVRVKDVEEGRAADKIKLAELEGENRLLQAMITGRVDWVAISDLLEEHHRQSLRRWTSIDEKLDRALASRRADPRGTE